MKTKILLAVLSAFLFFACTTQEKVQKFADRKPAKYDQVTLTHYGIPKYTPSFKGIVDKLYPYRITGTDTLYFYDSAAVAANVFQFIALADSAYREFINQYYIPKDSASAIRDSSAKALSLLAKTLIGHTTTVTRQITIKVKDSLTEQALTEELKYKDSVYSGQITILENKIDSLTADRDKFKDRSKNLLLGLIGLILIAVFAIVFIFRQALRPKISLTK